MSSSNKSSSKSISSGNCSIFSGILSHISETLSKASAQGAPLLRQVISSGRLSCACPVQKKLLQIVSSVMFCDKTWERTLKYT